MSQPVERVKVSRNTVIQQVITGVRLGDLHQILHRPVAHVPGSVVVVLGVGIGKQDRQEQSRALQKMKASALGGVTAWVARLAHRFPVAQLCPREREKEACRETRSTWSIMMYDVPRG